MSQTERFDVYQRPAQGWEPGPYGSGDRWVDPERQHTRQADSSGGNGDRDGHPYGGRSAQPAPGARSGPGRRRLGPDRRRPARGLRATLDWWMSQWGSHEARFGVTTVAACAAVGAFGTMLTGGAPGGLIGFFVVLGTVAACTAVRSRASYLIIPVPVLAYLVAAMVTGVVDQIGAASRTTFAIGALQWIARGFVSMVIATLCAIGIVGTRWWRTARPR